MASIAIYQQPTMHVTTAAAPISRGLVLSGGGAMAAYEVGVMKALLTGQSAATGYKPAEIDVVSATSAGSVNASLFLSAASPGSAAAVDFAEKVWLDDFGDAPGKCSGGAFRFRADPSSIFNPACYFPNPVAPWLDFLKGSAFLAEDFLKRGVMFGLSSHDIEQRTLEFLNFGSFISDEPYRKMLRNRIRLDQIRSSRTALRIATTNWKTGQLKVFCNSDMTDENGDNIILASSALPGLFGAVEISGEPYVDGGVVLNTPLKPAIDAGAEELHIIYMDPEIALLPLPRLTNTASALNRMLVIAFSATIKRDIEIASDVNQEVALALLSTGASSALHTGVTNLADAPHRQLTIHLHSPAQPLGGGWFTFARNSLKELIDRGFKDGVEHDCKVNQCLIPK